MKLRKKLALALVLANALSASAMAASYTVQPGDVLWKIAEDFGTDYQTLAAANDIDNPHLIYVGQEIVWRGTEAEIPTPEVSGALTKSASAKGFQSDVEVAVTMENGKITALEVVSHGETQGIGTNAIDALPSKIVEYQTVAVDGVAGATMTSGAIIEATKSALVALGANVADFSSAVEMGEVSTEVIEKSADVVIIGAGGAGLNAAVEVLRAGGSAILIEKMPSVGGNTLLSGTALNAYDPQRQEAMTILESELGLLDEMLTMEFEDELVQEWQATFALEVEEYKASGEDYLFDSPSLHKLHTYIGGDMIGSPEVIDAFAEGGLAAVEYIEDFGVEWIPSINSAIGSYWRRSHSTAKTFGEAGADYILPQAEFVRENGGVILTEYTAEQIVMEGGKVVGVKGRTAEGQPFEISADKNVILATGGFGSNVEMREHYNVQWPTLDASVPTTNGPTSMGEGIVMAEQIGANLVDMEWIQLLPTYGGGLFTPYTQNQLYINHDAKRFIAEDSARDDLASAILEQENGETWILSDANTVNDVIAPIYVAEMKVSQGLLFKADTLEELAELAGLDADTLIATVEDYNRGLREKDDSFGRKFMDQEIDDAPYYIGLSQPMIHHTMDGVEVNGQSEVLDTEGNVIEGLLAAGEVTGGLHGTNRLGGNGIADMVIFGRQAGINAMK